VTPARLVLRLAVLLALTALLLGVIAGLLELALEDDLPERAVLAGRVYVALWALLPLALLSATFQPPDPAPYRSPGQSAAMVGVAGALGAVAATVVFIVPASNLVAIFGDDAAADVYAAVRGAIGWTRFAVAVATTGLAGVMLGWWAGVRIADWRGRGEAS
jgi:hypothetical protein